MFFSIVSIWRITTTITDKVKQLSHTIFLLPEPNTQRGPEHANTLTYTILMYKKAFNKPHAAQRQFLRALNDLNRESLNKEVRRVQSFRAIAANSYFSVYEPC